MAGKLNDRVFSITVNAIGFAEFTAGEAEGAPTFTPDADAAGSDAGVLDYLSGFKGEYFKASVRPAPADVDVQWIDTANGKKYSVIACADIPKLLKSKYKATMWANFYKGKVPFLNLQLTKDEPKAPKAPAANKFAKAPAPKAPAGNKFGRK